MNQILPKGQRNPNWGGYRNKAGRKRKYGEPTKVMTFRIPVSKVDDIRQAIKYILESKKDEEYFENNY